MNRPEKIRVWIFVFALSLAFHAALLALPAYEAKKPEEKKQVITVNLRQMPKKAAPPKLAPPAPKPAAKPAAKPKPKPKPKPQPKPKPKPKHVPKKTEVKPEETPVPEEPTTLTQSEAEPVEQPAPIPADDYDNGGTEYGGEDAAGGGSPYGVEGGVPGGIVDASSLTVLKKVLPSYPSFSRKRREEGTVTVIVTIENGSVAETEVESSSGFARLDSSALEAVKQWKFDAPEKIRARVPFVFKLTN